MANTYVNNRGERFQRVLVEVWVPERIIEFVMEHTGRSRRAARKHIAQSYFHHGGELTFMDGDVGMGIENNDLGPISPKRYVDDEVSDLLDRGIIPYLDDDDKLIKAEGIGWSVI